MKILCFIDNLGSGGAQRQMVYLAKGFKSKGHDVSLLVYYDIPFFANELEEEGIFVKIIEDPSYFRRFLKLRKYIRDYNAETVLAFLDSTSFIAIFAGFPFRTWKLIVGERSANPAILKSLKARFIRCLYFFVDYIVSNSSSNINILHKANPFLGKSKIKLIYNIIDPTRIGFKYIPRTEQKYFKLVMVGRYVEEKNLSGLVEAINILPQSYKDRLKVEWYGNRNDVEIFQFVANKYETIIKEYSLVNVISLNDSVRNVFDIYADADFIALFSLFEGFPNVICEAMAMGKPVIASNVSDNSKFIKDGINGYLCDPTDFTSISNAIVRAMDTDLKVIIKMGELNRKFAETDFNPDKIVSEYLSLM